MSSPLLTPTSWLVRRIGKIQDRTAFEVTRDVVAQIGGGLVSPFRFFAQSLHHDVVEIA